MITLSAAIMHAGWAEERKFTVRALQNALRPAHRLQLVVDNDRDGIWPTARRAWMAASGTHHMVVQDDVQLCEGFLELATAAIEARPDAAISFFGFAGKAIRAARDAGLSWVGIEGHATGAAVCLPSAWVGEWLRWCRDHVAEDYRHDDTRLQVWLAATGRTMWFTVPCLAEHLGDKTSISGNRPPLARVAAVYNQQPGTIDWTKGLGDDQMLVRMKTRAQILANCPALRGVQ